MGCKSIDYKEEIIDVIMLISKKSGIGDVWFQGNWVIGTETERCIETHCCTRSEFNILARRLRTF